MHTAWPRCLVLALVTLACGNACANACSDDAPRRKVQAAAERKPQLHEGPPPTGAPAAPGQLARALPDAVGEFKALGPAELSELPLPNRGRLTAARRTYAAGTRSLVVEISDALHAPDLRGLVARAQGISKTSEDHSYEGRTLKGHQAVLQWHGKDKLGLANVLVAERFLAKLELRPAEAAAALAPLTASLPLHALRELTSEGGGGKPAAQVSDGGATGAVTADGPTP